MTLTYFDIVNRLKNIKLQKKPAIIFELENIIMYNNNINLNLFEIYNYIKYFNIATIVISNKQATNYNIYTIKKILDEYNIPYTFLYLLKEGRTDIESFKTKALENLIKQEYNIHGILCSKDESIYKKYTENYFQINIYEMKNILYTIIEEDEESASDYD
jgi:hypothetical protein